MTNGGGVKELERFQSYLSDYKIIVYDGLSPDRVIFDGNSLSKKKLYPLCDAGQYNVVTNLKAAMAKKYICNVCDTLYDNSHKCDRACSLCTATPPCSKDQSKYSATCNGWFLSEKCVQNHMTFKVKGKLVCQWRQECPNCSFTVTAYSKHECFKRFCNYCNKNQPSGHFCYVAPLKPSKLTDRFLYAFFDMECTQYIEHIPNRIFAQHSANGWMN